jgi:hypothetical protein
LLIQPTRDRPHQINGGCTCPVQVFEHQKHWLASGYLMQERAHSAEEVRLPGETTSCAALRHDVWQAWQAGAARVTVERVDPRSVGRFGEVIAPPHQDKCALRHGEPPDGPGQRGFANSRRTTDQDQAALTAERRGQPLFDAREVE